MKKNKIIDINKKSYLSIVYILVALIVFAIAVTYIVPRGEFGTKIDANGNTIVDYGNYIRLEGKGGINILKGLFGFVLVFFSSDGLSLIMLSLFLVVIAGAFQVMNDTNCMSITVKRLINKFINRKGLLIALLTFVFMCFGSFLGLFEEVLTLLPLIIMITVSLGYDSYLGFLICIVGTGFGFASGITNPFTVLTASELIGANPITNIWFRIMVFILMYGLLLMFIFNHVKKIKKNPLSSPTYEHDLNKHDANEEEIVYKDEKKIFISYVTVLLIILVSTIVITSIPAIRSYTIVFLTGLFLISGLLIGYVITHSFKTTFKSFGKGAVSCLPTILLVLLAASIKYILEEGMIIATISNSISSLIAGKNIYVVAIIIYAIILILEFFISSSTAKSIFVMGILGCVSVDLSKEMLVLVYLFGDGFTNVLFPTSPVLLIGLSMIGMNYFTWIRKSNFLFIMNLLLVLGLIVLAVFIGY